MKRKLPWIAGLVIGALLTLAPLWGMVATMIQMNRALTTLGNSGVGDPRTLSDQIGASLVSTATGIFLCPVGIALVVLSLVFLNRAGDGGPPPLPSPNERKLEGEGGSQEIG